MSRLKGKIEWIDIVKPTRQDIDALRRIHHFHPVTLDELLQYSERSRVERIDDYLYLTYHLPLYEPDLRTSRRGEIDFLITKDSVVTVHYEDLTPLSSFKHLLEKNADQKKRYLSSTLLCTHRLMEEIIAFSLRQIRHIEEHIRYISEEIFAGREEEMLRKISYVRRDILDYSVVSEPRDFLLATFLDAGIKFWGAAARPYLNELIGDHAKITLQLKNHRAVIESLAETNNQLLEAQTNRVIRRFTVLAFVVTLPMLSIFILGLLPFTAEIGAAKLSSILGMGMIFSLFTLYLAWKKKWL